MVKNLVIGFASGIIFNLQLFGQAPEQVDNKFSLSAQLRPRFEVRGGAFRPLNEGEKPAALVSERTRLSLDYSYKDLLSIRIAPQSVWIWGQGNMVQGAESNGNQFSLFEAWANLRLSELWNVKIGRQVISLDDERFFGELDWAQGGRVHDAASIHFGKDKIGVKGFFAFNQNYKTLYANNLNNPSGNLYSTADAFPYKSMQALWASYRFNEKSKISFLATNLGLQNAIAATADTIVNNMQTLGANYFFTGKKLTATLSAYYQFGKNIAGIQTQAYLLAAYGTYNFTNRWNLGLGTDWVSGNDLGKYQSGNNAFNPFFHTGHKFYGNMDYYYVGNGHKSVGLSDNYLRLGYKTGQGNTVNLGFHQFFTPNTVATSQMEYSKNLGQEADLSFACKVNPFTNITGGYSFYLNTPTVNFLKNTPTGKDYQQWFWLSLNVSPTIFKAKFQ